MRGLCRNVPQVEGEEFYPILGGHVRQLSRNFPQDGGEGLKKK